MYTYIISLIVLCLIFSMIYGKNAYKKKFQIIFFALIGAFLSSFTIAIVKYNQLPTKIVKTEYDLEKMVINIDTSYVIKKMYIIDNDTLYKNIHIESQPDSDIEFVTKIDTSFDVLNYSYYDSIYSISYDDNIHSIDSNLIIYNHPNYQNKIIIYKELVIGNKWISDIALPVKKEWCKIYK